MLEAHLEEVKEFLRSSNEDVNIVVMPDFFLDRFISLNCNPSVFSRMVAEVAERKGGSIDGISQTDFRGGNAVNTASALASLDAKVTIIACTDRLGVKLLKLYVKSPKINLSHVKILQKPSITTALEFNTKNGKTNIMLRDVGSLSDFGPENLNSADFEVIEKADCVCVFNWAGTRRFGTELAQTVFHHAKMKGKGKTYYDTADPTSNREKATKLMQKVLQDKIVDILSLNENEAVFYASLLDDEIGKTKQKRGFENLARHSAKLLASRLSARIDLHTTSFSATFTKNSETIVPAFQVQALRATGAGDSWNAGNILGSLYKLSDEARLTLANAVAAYYISNPEGKHPTRKELIRFCNKMKKKQTTKTDKNQIN